MSKISKEQEISRFWSRVVIASPSECWAWVGRKNIDGYGQFDHNNTCSNSHRYSWSLKNGDVPNGMVICHSCDNPACVNPSHLFLGTVQDNVRDRDEKGRQASHVGTKNGRARLDESKVMQIRELRKSGFTYKKLAYTFSVSVGCISHILNNRHWVSNE